jgi:hypothetical protein
MVLSITQLRPELNGQLCYSETGSIIDNTMTGNTANDTIINNGINKLPTSNTGSVTAGTGNFVSDLFSSILSFFKIDVGLKFASNIINAPTNILGCMGLPIQISNVLGVLWNSISLFIFVSYIFWRD